MRSSSTSRPTTMGARRTPPSRVLTKAVCLARPDADREVVVSRMCATPAGGMISSDEEGRMSFEEVMGAMNRLATATDALAAAGAHLMLQGQDQPAGDAATRAALKAVCDAAGLGGIDDLA